MLYPTQYYDESPPPRGKTNDKPRNSSNRICVGCKKPSQVQCLHCSEYVCLECAQRHVNLVAQESDGAMQLLNEKFDVLDRIAANTRQRITAEHDKIVRTAGTERDRSFALLAQMVEDEKQQLRNKNIELNGLPLNEISLYIRQLESNVQHLTDKNDTLFSVSSTAPQITLRRQSEGGNTSLVNAKKPSGMKFDDEDEYLFTAPRKSEVYISKTNPRKSLPKSKFQEYDEEM